MLCYYVLPCLHVAMFCPSYLHACYHLVTEVPWPWHLRHRCHDSSATRVISRGVPFSYYYHVGHIYIMWGVWVHPSYRSWLQGDWLVCALHPITWSWSLHPVILAATPLVHVEATPQLNVHTFVILDELGALYHFMSVYLVLLIIILF